MPKTKPTGRAEAIEAGISRYFTGEPCPQGHVADRYTIDSFCVKCRSIANMKNRAAVRLKLKGQNHA